MQAYAPLYPAIVVGLAAVVVLFSDAFGKDRARSVGTAAATVGVLWAAWTLASQLGTRKGLFAGTWVSDPMGQFGTAMILAAGLVLFAASWKRKLVGRGETEYFGLLLMSMFGALVMVGAADLIVLYLGIEMTTMPLYVLVAFSSEEKLGGEGALKYFMQGLLASLVMVYGMSFLYGVTGTTALAGIAAQAHTVAAGRAVLFSLSILLVSVGFLFKLAAAPFHFWAPDVYEGAPTVVTATIAFVPKVAGLIGLLRLYPLALADARSHWSLLFAGIAVVSMFAGNILAFAQTNVKRMLAFSAVAHAGYMLAGVAAGTPEAVRATVFYMLVYGAATVCAFAVLVAAKAETLEDLSGLGHNNPFLAVAMFVSLLSLIGLPPFGGFIGKLLVFGAVIHAGLTWLAVVGVINSVISVGYYFYIARAMFLVGPGRAPAPLDAPATSAVGACFAASVVLGIWFGPVVEFLTKGIG